MLLNRTQVGVILNANGFHSRINTGIAITKAESGWNTLAVNRANSNGSVDYGLWQVNSIHRPTRLEQIDAYANTRKAFTIYRASNYSFRPWVAYTTLRYVAYLPVYPGRLIKVNATGPDVIIIQLSVNATPDGIFGPKTLAAVKSYQSLYRLTVDGIVGPLTWSVMRKH